MSHFSVSVFGCNFSDLCFCDQCTLCMVSHSSSNNLKCMSIPKLHDKNKTQLPNYGSFTLPEIDSDSNPIPVLAS